MTTVGVVPRLSHLWCNESHWGHALIPLSHRIKRLECVKIPHMCLTLLGDGDFLKSIQMGLFRTRCHIECLKSFCCESNSRGFRRKVIHMIPRLIEAMIHEGIGWWRSAMRVIAHDKRSHEGCCRPPRLRIMSNHHFVPRHASPLHCSSSSSFIPHPRVSWLRAKH